MELKQEQLKKRTFSKVQWAVNAFQDWRSAQMESPDTFDVRIYETDLERIELLEKDSFEFSMCKFIAEVRKLDGSKYPGSTLYQLVVSIQKHLIVKGKKWKLIESGSFSNLRMVLDNLMKEQAAANIGTTKRQASFITLDIEEKLWCSGLLGESTRPT